MSLSSHQLDAFLEVARLGNFSKAAKSLHVTQSALSQRVLNLENDLGTTLVIREPKGLRLSEVGETLLRYCLSREKLEGEVLDRLKAKDRSKLGGMIRIAGFSSVMRSVILPCLSPLIRNNPEVQIGVVVREMKELPGLLRSGEVDLVVLDSELKQAGIKSIEIGFEENVLVESKQKSERVTTILDHDSEDPTSAQFFKLQRASMKDLRRSFLDEIYGLVDGVILGWGRAVVPRHLVRGVEGVRIMASQKSLNVPVVLNYYEQAYYPQLFLEAVALIEKNARKMLLN